ncbi:hypothetical protein M231_07997 [Tremella mesenterica]|uniref:Uncharacterized protein n=1 Tax=Tremella mesenterica TaxID=5217 RepID=A0A4Q1BDB0_TREME|nr:hypothetical protein M231_07997 [Tremella mesenterica]
MQDNVDVSTPTEFRDLGPSWLSLLGCLYSKVPRVDDLAREAMREHSQAFTPNTASMTTIGTPAATDLMLALRSNDDPVLLSSHLLPLVSNRSKRPRTALTGDEDQDEDLNRFDVSFQDHTPPHQGRNNTDSSCEHLHVPQGPSFELDHSSFTFATDFFRENTNDHDNPLGSILDVQTQVDESLLAPPDDHHNVYNLLGSMLDFQPRVEDVHRNEIGADAPGVIYHDSPDLTDPLTQTPTSSLTEISESPNGTERSSASVVSNPDTETVTVTKRRPGRRQLPEPEQRRRQIVDRIRRAKDKAYRQRLESKERNQPPDQDRLSSKSVKSSIDPEKETRGLKNVEMFWIGGTIRPMPKMILVNTWAIVVCFGIGSVQLLIKDSIIKSKERHE